MTKDEVIRETAKATGLKQVDVEKTYEALIATLKASFIKGEGHMIPGFVNFRPVVKEAYDGRNPKTGEPLRIPAKMNLKVTVSDNLLDEMQQQKVIKAKLAEQAKGKKD